MKTTQSRSIAALLLAAFAMIATACTDVPDLVEVDDAIDLEVEDRSQPASGEASTQQSRALGPTPVPSSRTLEADENEPDAELAPGAVQPIGEDVVAALANAVSAGLDQVTTVSTPTGDWMLIVSPPVDITDEIVSATDGAVAPPEDHVIVGIDAMVALGQADTSQIPSSALVWQIVGGATRQLYSSGFVDSATVCGSRDRTLTLSESFATYDSVRATLCVTVPVEDLTHPDTQVVVSIAAQEYWTFDETTFHSEGALSAAWESDFTDWSGVGPDSAVDISVDDDNEAPIAFVAIYSWEPEERSITDLGCGDNCDEIVASLLRQYDSRYPNSAVLARTFCNGCDSLNLLAVVRDAGSPSGYDFADRDEFIELITPIDTSFEAMIASGSAGYFRQADGVWRTIDRSLLSGCSPIIRRHSILEIASNGSLHELEVADRYEGPDCDY